MRRRSATSSWWCDPWLWTAAAAAGRHAVGVWRLRQTMAYLSRRPSAIEPVDTAVAVGVAAMPVVHMVIPVLWEQAHVGAALRWFAELARDVPGATVTIVTTDRENREREHLIDAVTRCPMRRVTARRFPHLGAAELRDLTEAPRAGSGDTLAGEVVRSVLSRRRLTCEVVADLLHDAELADAPIRHVHYPGMGRKAAQVNYAVGLLDARDGDYVAVYDVDSRPDLTVLRRTLAEIAARQSADGHLPPVVQQSARFDTAGAAVQAWQRHLCRGAARLQTLWTLRREIPSFRRYATATSRPTGLRALDAARRGLAQTVGHGLLIRIDVFRQVGGLPEYTVLDDLPFGYQLTAAGVPVHPAPMTLVAPAPEHVADLVATHRRWFRNYLDYPACAHVGSRAGRGSPVEHAVALGVAGYRAATWLLASPVTAACTVAVVRRTGAPAARAVAAVALWLGCVTPVRMLAATSPDRPSLGEQAREAAEVYAAYLLKSIGPIAALADTVMVAASPASRLTLSPKTHHRRLDPNSRESKEQT